MIDQSNTKRTGIVAELGAISADAAYPLALFQRLTGLGGWAMRKAQRDGLKVRKQGRVKFIRGCDWIEYLGAVEAEKD